MTRQEKKERILTLLGDLYKSANVDEAIETRKKIIKEIFSAGFSKRLLPTIQMAIDAFGRDIDRSVISVLQEKKDVELAKDVQLSVVGLLALIDLSLLEP